MALLGTQHVAWAASPTGSCLLISALPGAQALSSFEQVGSAPLLGEGRGCAGALATGVGYRPGELPDFYLGPHPPVSLEFLPPAWDLHL